ncbi:MAG: lipase maturation factor family protein, partial [Bacteroidota bacterium]
MIRFLLVSGVLAGIYIFIGGPYLWLAFLYCFLVYLSFDLAFTLTFPWDCLIFETCFIAIFLPDLPLLPEWVGTTLPHPAISFLYLWLLFRLLFGFGKTKFSKSNWKDSGYFRGFLHNIPLPSRLVKYLYKAPDFLFLFFLWYAFWVEIIVPFMIFVPGLPRVIGAVSIIVLMIGIQALANFGYFNILAALLAFTLFDHQAALWNEWPIHFTQGENIGMHLLLGFYIVGGLVSLPFNSWCASTWMYWPSDMHIRFLPLRWIVSFLRVISRWRLIHAFGVFPPKGQPCMKLVLIIEGSHDAAIWKPYHYKYQLSHPNDKLYFIAPYHPRFDHNMFYLNTGVNDSNFLSSIIGSCVPYDFSRRGDIDYLVNGILEGRLGINKYFEKAPFSETNPPTWVRAGQYWFEPNLSKDKNATGNKWQMYLGDIHKMPSKYDKNIAIHKNVYPELFHWDMHYWKMRTR